MKLLRKLWLAIAWIVVVGTLGFLVGLLCYTAGWQGVLGTFAMAGFAILLLVSIVTVSDNAATMICNYRERRQ